MSQVRILVAAPDPGLAEDAAHCLTRLGYAVEGPALTGPDAVRLARERRPDLALLDVRLPAPLDGPATADSLRRDLGLPAVLLVPPSGPALERAVTANADGLAFNSLDGNQVRAAVERALERHRAKAGPPPGDPRLVALDALPDAVLLADPAGRVSFLNPAAERLTGWSGAEAAGRPLNEVLRLRDARTREEIAGPAAWALEQAGLPGRALLRGPEGRELHVSLTAGRVPARGDGPPGFVLVVRDVTEVRRLEERERLAEKMEAVGQLAGGVANHFNNLLTVIYGYADLLADALVPGHPWRPFLEEIRKAGDRASELTGQLLTLFQKQLLQPPLVDLNSLIAAAAPALRHLLGGRIELMTDLGTDLPGVRSDAEPLERILFELAFNGRDAMPDGGVLTVQTAVVDLTDAEVRARPGLQAARCVRLRVSDTGPALAEAVRARVFEPFFSPRPASASRGLGLAMVYGIVRARGGDVEVTGGPGEGTVITIHLPAAEGGARPSSLTLPGGPRGSETLLLVDDEAMVRQLNRHILQMCGYAVLEAGDGEEALRVEADHGGPIDLLITDLRMPRLGGLDLARALRVRRPGIKILFLSGTPEDAGEPADRPAGSRILPKPYAATELARVVREVLDATG